MTFKLGELVPQAPLARPCWRKERWRSEGAAGAQLRALLRHPRLRDGATLRVYRCKYCDGYHVGHLKGATP